MWPLILPPTRVSVCIEHRPEFAGPQSGELRGQRRLLARWLLPPLLGAESSSREGSSLRAAEPPAPRVPPWRSKVKAVSLPRGVTFLGFLGCSGMNLCHPRRADRNTPGDHVPASYSPRLANSLHKPVPCHIHDDPSRLLPKALGPRSAGIAAPPHSWSLGLAKGQTKKKKRETKANKRIPLTPQ